MQGLFFCDHRPSHGSDQPCLNPVKVTHGGCIARRHQIIFFLRKGDRCRVSCILLTTMCGSRQRWSVVSIAPVTKSPSMRRRRSCWIACRATAFRVHILLDVQIPNVDGPALQKRLRELGSTLPIIFLSGYLDIPVTVRTIKAGAEGLFHKASIIRRSASGNRTGVCTSPNIPRATDQTGCCLRATREADAARAPSL